MGETVCRLVEVCRKMRKEMGEKNISVTCQSNVCGVVGSYSGLEEMADFDIATVIFRLLKGFKNILKMNLYKV